MYKKANSAAIILIVLVLILGTMVLLQKPDEVPTPQVDYGEVLTQVESSLQETSYVSYQTTLRKGGGSATSAWFDNGAAPPSMDEMLSLYKELIIEHLKEIELESGAELNIDNYEQAVDVRIENDEIIVSIQGVDLKVETQEELRTQVLDKEIRIHSNLPKMYKVISDFMGSDAGGLLEALDDLNKGKACQFDACCCGYTMFNDTQTFLEGFVYDGDEVGKLVKGTVVEGFYSGKFEKDRIKQSEIKALVDEKISELDQAMQQATQQGDASIKCFVDWPASIINIEEDFWLRWEQRSCLGNNDACPIERHNEAGVGGLGEWPDEKLTKEGDISYRGNVTTNFQFIDIDYSRETNYTNVSSGLPYYLKALFDRKTAFNVEVVCRAGEQNVPDFEELRVNIRVAAHFQCDDFDSPPEPDPDTDENALDTVACISGSAGGPNVCPKPEDATEQDFCTPEDFRIYKENLTSAYPNCDASIWCVISEGCLEVQVPDANRPCGVSDVSYHGNCRRCGEKGQCDEPALVKHECKPRNGCVEYHCDGTTMDFCPEIKVLDNSNCGRDGKCRGVCTESGACDFSAKNGLECSKSWCGGQYKSTGSCEQGTCNAPDPKPKGKFCCKSNDVCNDGSEICCENLKICMPDVSLCDTAS